jgi:hypothetical protein
VPEPILLADAKGECKPLTIRVKKLSYERLIEGKYKGAVSASVDVHFDPVKATEKVALYGYDLDCKLLPEGNPEEPLFVLTARIYVDCEQPKELSEDDARIMDAMFETFRFATWPYFRELFSSCVNRAGLPPTSLPIDVSSTMKKVKNEAADEKEEDD